VSRASSVSKTWDYNAFIQLEMAWKRGTESYIWEERSCDIIKVIML
jgi:hypothetical protein